MGDGQPPTEEQRPPGEKSSFMGECLPMPLHDLCLLMKGLWGTLCAILLGYHSCQLPTIGHPACPEECKFLGTGHWCGMKTSGHWVPGVRTQTRYRDKALEAKWANHSLMKTKSYCFAAVVFSFQKILELLCRPF